ncbi:hypothetical protein BLOT_000812 [Blomia tropicalis]|nr:hypothetical protein BLOT_000812 [Blomia tropicalis]
MKEMAIVIDSVGFSYNKFNTVLRDVSINIPKGHIYALLGSNGCGKTTLLNILLGRITPHKGTIHILGHRINASQRLNHFIGYMPQDIALNPDLDITETFLYFARVNHVFDHNFVDGRIRSYLDMLNLDNPKQYVKHLSGGQKRLLSLGVTMIYEPKILLLDEPTVGVDSMIRCKIWQHLNTICRQNQTTVIITTHYIDEAKQSDLVGFLKQGSMLAEESPIALMSRFECDTLEEVFYKLCLRKNLYQSNFDEPRYKKLKDDDDLMIENLNNNDHNTTLDAINSFDTITEKMESEKILVAKCSNQWINFEHIHALSCREYVGFKSNLKPFFVFTLIPLITILLFTYTYGRTPRNLGVAIYNDDIELNETGHFSKNYIESLESSMIKMSHFSNEELAYESVRKGHNVMALAFRQNFSNALLDRYFNRRLDQMPIDEHERNIHKKILSESSIHNYYDQSQLLNVRFLNRSVMFAFQKVMQDYGKMSGINPYLFSTPIEIEHVEYGFLEPNFQDLFQAGIIMMILMVIAIGMSSLKLVQTRLDGCLERDLNQGVKPFEVFISFLLSHFGPLTIQVFVTIIFAYVILGIASFSVIAVIFFTAGILWPTEGMPPLVQKVLLINPLMLPIRSLRSIMLRAWSPNRIFVLIGYISSLANCLFLFIVDAILFHYSVNRIH